jgi:nucleotide-binding universal stress UspA family protein
MTVSEDENVNVIIIGNDTKQSENGFKIGILAEKLTRKSQKPVWVHRTDKSTEPQNILCPVDFSDASARALNNALKIARIFDSKLYILNVYESISSFYSPRLKVDPKEIDEQHEKDNQKTFDSFLKDFNFSGINKEIVSLKGEPYEKISKFIGKKDIDLMLIGATGKSTLTRILLGSLTEQIARDLKSSLITVKSENILNLKIDSDISDLEKHYDNATNLEKNGFFTEAAEQLKICLRINDLHVPSLSRLVKIYEKLGEEDEAKSYAQKLDEILRRLWDKKIEFEIRRHYKVGDSK